MSDEHTNDLDDKMEAEKDNAHIPFSEMLTSCLADILRSAGDVQYGAHEALETFSDEDFQLYGIDEEAFFHLFARRMGKEISHLAEEMTEAMRE